MQDLDKRDAVADKRVEHVSADLAKLKTEKDGLQDQLLQATSQLEHTRCELQTSQGMHAPTSHLLSYTHLLKIDPCTLSLQHRLTVNNSNIAWEMQEFSRQ